MRTTIPSNSFDSYFEIFGTEASLVLRPVHQGVQGAGVVVTREMARSIIAALESVFPERRKNVTSDRRAK